MSYCSERKSEILAMPIRKNCCRRAFFLGILAAKATLSDRTVRLRLSDREQLSPVSSAATELFGKVPEVTSCAGGRSHLLVFESGAAQKLLSDIFSGDFSAFEKCPLCRQMFLRGLFVAAGRLSDPSKQYLLEFSFGEHTDLFASFFTEIGLPVRSATKKSERILYLKNSTAIEDFFSLAGLNQLTFGLMNKKIEKEIKNSVHRVANCEVNNMKKAVDASQRQIAVIRELERASLLTSLPEDLILTAKMRLRYDDYSLARLAASMTPPISKPGLSHRLRKIEEIAATVLQEKQSATKTK